MNKMAAKFAVALTLAALSFPEQGLAETGPFTHFAGAWTGSGSVSMDDGSSERIRCRANYRVDESGASVEQVLRCASDSYRFDIQSNVMSREGNLTGSWTEFSRNISGQLEGRVQAGQVTASLQAATFAATLQIILRGKRQSVSISSAGQIRHVSINLSRM